MSGHNLPDSLRNRKKAAPKPKAATKTQKHQRPLGWTALCLIAAVISCLAFSGIQIYKWTYATSLAPIMEPIRGLEMNTAAWGTYRSHTYFGLRQRHPQSPLFGMMWYEQPDQQLRPSVRHWCDQNDDLSRYGWFQADGRTFGRQNITEKGGHITVDWLNYEDTWTARVSVTPLKQRRFNLIFYLTSQSDMRFKHNQQEASVYSKYISFQVREVTGKNSPHSALLWDEDVDLTRLNDLILMNTGVSKIDNRIVYTLNAQKKFTKGAFAALQFYVNKKSTFEISLSTKNTKAHRGEAFLLELEKRSKQFNTKFEQTFNVSDKDYPESVLRMGHVAMANMLGSVGYWYGYNKALDGNKIVPYGPHQLFSAVPSRPFFPRGFLWDEGFHALVIEKFDPTLSIEILVSWLNTMNENGWMPREMILGVEAEARVPAEFVTQYPNNANPPSMFIVVNNILSDMKLSTEYDHVLRQVYIRMERWFNWLLKSQNGRKEGTMRWRGRNGTSNMELNPKTLTSGLDDYPRASHPSADEYHLDLRCWMALCSQVMVKLSSRYGSELSKKRFTDIAQQFSDYSKLKDLHWDSKTKIFADFGFHSTDVRLVREEIKVHPPQYKVIRKAYLEPQLSFVGDAFGYNSLYPLIFHLVPPDAPELFEILNKIKDPEELWTDFGLRSLSKKSPYYAARNTEHDPPYWRGYIWVNLNYLVVSALHHYGTISGPFQNLANLILHDLRSNIINNMAAQFNRTGYIWENYDDQTGAGRGSHPFNGWSSLVLLMMSDAPQP